MDASGNEISRITAQKNNREENYFYGRRDFITQGPEGSKNIMEIS